MYVKLVDLMHIPLRNGFFILPTLPVLVYRVRTRTPLGILDAETCCFQALLFSYSFTPESIARGLGNGWIRLLIKTLSQRDIIHIITLNLTMSFVQPKLHEC